MYDAADDDLDGELMEFNIQCFVIYLQQIDIIAHTHTIYHSGRTNLNTFIFNAINLAFDWSL